jgi:SAM-dependent methyltransferase
MDHFAVAERVAETLDIGPGTRVFEVDCGDGSLLYHFHQNGYVVGGMDDDPSMIARALEAMPDGLFTVGRASALDPAMPWDVVICRSLVGLSTVWSAEALAEVEASAKVETSDLDHVRGLVARMFAKATHAIALLDVPEPHHRPLLHALADVGAKAIQIDGAHIFARV